VSTTTSNSTVSLEQALTDLPAKLRVHELAKRAGVSSKEVLAALAAAGGKAASAASSVGAVEASAYLTALLGSSEDDVAPAGPAAESELVRAVERAVPVLDPGQQDPGFFAAPLFLPPAEAKPVRRGRRTTAAADVEPAEASSAGAGSTPEGSVGDALLDASADRPDADAPQKPTRRRRGRSGGRSSADPADGSPGHIAAADRDAGQDGQDGQDRTAVPDAVTAVDATAAVDATGSDIPADGNDESGAEAVSEEDEAEQAARRRRRRGRRGRGRVGDDRQDDADEMTDTESAVAGRPADGGSPTDEATDPESDVASGSGSGDREAVGDDATDNDAEDETNEDGTTRRRRRRRRRAGSSDSGPDVAKSDDDPDNTVVHVREPRSKNDVKESSVGAAGSGSSEVQGVRGSTRLEAKRQRRRDSAGGRKRPQILTEAEFLARREAVDRVMAVRQRGDLAQVALLEDGILVEHFVSRAGSESLMGNIYLGKVQNVLPSMEAAFVDIGKGRNAVLYAGEVNWDAAGLAGKARRIETALSGGETLLVQVSKDPVGAKGARLTTQISLPGRFLVYVPGGGATGISRKLPDTERKRLKSILDRIVPEDAGVIIRTAAEGVAEEELARDVERLKSQWEEISRQAEKKSNAPLMLSAEPDTLIRVVRDLFNSDISRLILEGDRAYEPVAAYIDAVAPELSDRVSRYDGPNDVFAAYRVDEQIAKALERKVFLPSGGSLVIDRTEAMTVVDVNTGKYTGSGGNLEETVTKNNLEAAEEVVRQLRLRDIGGIIVVDFIDMVLESNRELVMRRLTECLGRDRTRHQVAEVTSLGLIQMTRKKMGTGLVEAFSEPCPHCNGRGIVLHDVPMEDRSGNESGGDPGEDKRSGRNRRGKIRPETVTAEVEPPKSVPTTVRPPDPRGPKPRGRTGSEEGDAGETGGHSESGHSESGHGESGHGAKRQPGDDSDSGSGRNGDGTDVPQGQSADIRAEELPDAPAASGRSNRSSGRRSDRAGDASFNAPLSRDASDAVTAVLAALDAQSSRPPRSDATSPAGAPAGIPAGTPEPAPAAGSFDGTGSSAVPDAAPAVTGGRRRGRRAAGRPAGAPSSALDAPALPGPEATLVEPLPSEPLPSEPQSSEPLPLEPQSLEPQSLERQSLERQSLERQSLERQSLERQSLERQSSEPLPPPVTAAPVAATDASGTAGTGDGTPVEPAAKRAPRRRGSRAAGAATSVEVPVERIDASMHSDPAGPVPSAATQAAVPESKAQVAELSERVAVATNGEVGGGSNGTSGGGISGGDPSAGTVPAPPTPRRRRAASRPAGPAAVPAT